MEITVSHESRCTRDAVAVIIVRKRHTRMSVVLIVGRLIVRRIAEQNAVFVQTKFAVRDRNKIGIAFEIQKFVPVIGLGRCSVDLIVSDKGNVVDPVV